MDEDRLKRYDLTNEEWARLEPFLPRQPRQGHRWHDHRLVIERGLLPDPDRVPVAGPAGAVRDLEDGV